MAVTTLMNTCSIDSNAYLFYVSFPGLERAALGLRLGLGLALGGAGLGLGLVTAGLDYNTAL